MGLSIPHILLVLAVVLLLFGRGKISELMGDFAKGIRSFKRNLAEDDGPAVPRPARQIRTSLAAGGRSKAG